MAKTGSYIKLDRGLKTNSLWLEKPFSRGQAWVDLLLLAQGINREKEYRGKVQHMKPGVVYTSILYLSTRWGWGRARVYRFLEYLIDLKMVEIQGWTRNDTIKRTQNSTKNSTTNGTIITIENWALYQDSDTKDDTNDGTQNDTTERTPSDTHNRKHTENVHKEKANRNNRGRSASRSPSEKNETDDDDGLMYDSPVGKVKRGTDKFRNVSHLILKPEEGTEDDIPRRYRELCKGDFATYVRYRNQ